MSCFFLLCMQKCRDLEDHLNQVIKLDIISNETNRCPMHHKRHNIFSVVFLPKNAHIRQPQIEGNVTKAFEACMLQNIKTASYLEKLKRNGNEMQCAILDWKKKKLWRTLLGKWCNLNMACELDITTVSMLNFLILIIVLMSSERMSLFLENTPWSI